MSAKVLVVDDSLTIQKVVSITLAKSGYTLVAAHDEDELFNELEKETFDLILLDFNLSETLSGYELAKKIKEKARKCNLLAMIGTFDNVNNVEMTESGIDASIIKPFESTKFVEMCVSLIGEVSITSSSDDLILEDDDEDENDDWETNTSISNTNTLIKTSNIDLSDEQVTKDEPLTNSLKEEIEGWGINLPDIIEASEVTKDMEGSNILMPPKIDENEVEFNIPSEDESIVPEIGKEINDDDLLFPETNNFLENKETSSKLSSLSELNLEDEDEDEFTLSVNDFDENDEDLIKEFEVEEDDEFWATEDDDEIIADEEVGPKLESIDNEEIGPKLETVVNDDKFNSEVGPKLEKIDSVNIDIEQMIERVKAELTPMIEKLIEEKISSSMAETIERVAWEAIPDMAENLVRNEVKEISQKIQEKHSL